MRFETLMGSILVTSPSLPGARRERLPVTLVMGVSKPCTVFDEEEEKNPEGNRG